MNDSQVTLQAGEDVKEHLSRCDDVKYIKPHQLYPEFVGIHAGTVEAAAQHANHLHSNDVIGEDVRAACRRTGDRAPSASPPQPQVEDVDAEREEEKDVRTG